MNHKEQMSAILQDFYDKIANGEEIPDDYERVAEVEKHVFFKSLLPQEKKLNPHLRNEENTQFNGRGFGNIALAIENKSEQSYFIDIFVGSQYMMSLKLKSGNIEWIFGKYFIPLVGLQYHCVELQFRLYNPDENESDETIRNRTLVEPDYQNIWVYYADVETELKNNLATRNKFIFPTFMIRWTSGIMGKSDINDNDAIGVSTFDPYPDELCQYYEYVLK